MQLAWEELESALALFFGSRLRTLTEIRQQGGSEGKWGQTFKLNADLLL